MSETQYMTLAASAARTTALSAEPTARNRYCTGVVVHVAATAKASTPSVTFTIQGYDEASGTWYDILTSAALTDVGTANLTVHPAITSVSNVAKSAVLPRRWRVISTPGDTDALTYSVGACLIP